MTLLSLLPDSLWGWIAFAAMLAGVMLIGAVVIRTVEERERWIDDLDEDGIQQFLRDRERMRITE